MVDELPTKSRLTPTEQSGALLQPYEVKAQRLFVRCPKNPILQPSDMPIPCKAVCNPAAIVIDDYVLLLLRVIDHQDRSHLFVARSKDGVSGWTIESEPLLTPLKDAGWYDNIACEDPRITFMEDTQEFAITYVGVSEFGACVCLALTGDFVTARRLGIVIHPYNKDAAILPKKFDGKYRLLHRPTSGPLEDVWMSSSPDLLHWGEPVNVLRESDQPGWYDGKVGTGPTPIETEHGWLLLFHGVQSIDQGWIYRMGMVMLDKDEPSRIIVKWPYWLMEPQEPYEFSATNRAIIFPTGAFIRDGILQVYYGAGDTVVAVATVDADSLKEFRNEISMAQSALEAKITI
jgi:predicted GH43/DUF377 family glycosyl hydrolase